MLSIEQQRLVEDNIGLVGKTIQKYYPSLAWDDDVYQIGCLGLVKAAERFNPEIAKFSTYAVSSIRSSIWQSIKKQKTQSRKANNITISIHAPVQGTEGLTIEDVLEDPIDFVEELIHREIMYKSIENLSPKEIEVVRFKLLDFKILDMVKILGVSQPSISRRFTSAKEKLKGAI